MSDIPAILAIDPGKSGAVCLLVGDIPILYDTPVMNDGKKNQYDLPEMYKMFREAVALYPEVTAIIEEVGPMPGQGVTSMYSMGYGSGLWHMLLVCLDIPFRRVRPQEWKKEFGLKGKDKGASILRAKELFPKADIRLKKHDGRAEALLLAEFCRRRIKGVIPSPPLS